MDCGQGRLAPARLIAGGLRGIALAVCALPLACASGGSSAGGKADASAGFAAFDGDGDRAISREEYADAIAAGFAAMDGDGDGVLRGPELSRLPPGLLAQLDVSRDGAVSLDEYLDQQIRSFIRCDADGDTRLAEAEANACAGLR